LMASGGFALENSIFHLSNVPFFHGLSYRLGFKSVFLFLQ